MVHSSVWAISGLLKRIDPDQPEQPNPDQPVPDRPASHLIMPGDVLDVEKNTVRWKNGR